MILVVLMLLDDQYVVFIFFSFSFLSCKFVLYVCFCTNVVYKVLFFFNTTCRFVFTMRSVISIIRLFLLYFIPVKDDTVA